MKPQRPISKPLFLAAITLAGFTFTPSSGLAADSTWDGGGANPIWGGVNNWDPNGRIANGVDATATFAKAFGNGRTILLNTDRTLGQIVYTDPGAEPAMTISWHSNNPTRVLTLNVSTGTPTIDVTQADRTLTITARLGGTEGMTKVGPGTLVLSPPGSAPNHFISGLTTIQTGTLVLSDGLALANSVIDATNSIDGDATNGLRNDVATMTLGGLAGVKNLSSLFTTTSGGYDTVTSLTLNPGAGVSASYSGVIADGAAGMTLTKTGDGTQTFSGTNTYTGATSVTAGTLEYSTACSSATDITVAANATSGVLVAADDDQWANTGNLTQDDSSALVIDYGGTTPSTTVAPILVNNLSLGAGLTLTATLDSPSLLLAGLSYPLVTWTTSGPADVSAFTTLTLAHRVEGSLSVVGNTLYLNITSNAAGPISWNTGDGDWDTVATNWLDSQSAPTTYFDALDAVEFGDATGVTGNPTVTLAATFSPVGVIMKSTNHDYSITGTGAVSGTAALTLDATNSRTLGIATYLNDYSGDTTIDGGTLQLLDYEVIPDGAGKGNVAVNGTFDLNTFQEVINGLSGSGTVDTVAGGTPTFTVGGNNASSVFSGVIRNTTGTLTLAKTGTGTQILSGTNTYSGGTNITSGTLQVGDGGTSGTLGSGEIVTSGTLVFNRSDALAVSEVISGSGGVIQSGGGTLTLSSENTYTGDTAVSGGILNLTGSIAGDSASSDINIAPTAGNSIVNYNGGESTLRAVTGANVVGTSSVLNMTGGTIHITPGTTTGTQSVSGAGHSGTGGYGCYHIVGGTFRDTTGTPGGARFTMTGRGTASPTSGPESGIQTAVVYVGGTGLIDQTNGEWWLNYSLGQITVADSGKIDRTGSSTFFGLFMDPTSGVTGGGYGVLNLAGADAEVVLGTSAIRFGNSTVAGRGDGQSGFVNLAAGTLSVGANVSTSLPASPSVINNAYFNFAGGTVKASGSVTDWIPASNASINFNSNLFGPIDNSAVAGAPANFIGGLTVDSDTFDLAIANPLQAPGGAGVTQADLSVSGGSGYVGPPAVIFSSDNVLPGGTPAAGYALISGGGVMGIVITAPGAYTPGTTPTVTLIGGGGTGASVTAGALNTPNTSGGLTKVGDGTLVLSGANTYTGPTLVSAGTLKFSTAGSVASDIAVAGTAGGGVLVATADDQFGSGGDLTYDNNSILVVDYGSTTPSTTVAPLQVANLVLGSNLSLRLEGDMVSGLVVSQTYPLATWTTSGPSDGTAFTSILTHRLAGTFSVVGNTLSFTVTSNAQGGINWNTGTGTWDTVASNWLDSNLASTTYFDTLDTVVFGDAAGVSGNPAITLNSDFAPVNMTMSSTSHDYTITGTGAIGGTGSLTLDAANTQTLTLATANTYTGATIIDGGTLQLGSGGPDGSLNPGSPVSVASGAAFAINQSDTVIQGTDFAAAAIDGAGGFAQAGSGTTVLNAANTYSGPTSISGGTLQIEGAGQLDGGNYAGNIAISGGATLQYSSNASQTLSGIIGGAGSLIQDNAAATLRLSGTNTYTGATSVSGTLLLSNADALSTTTGISLADGAVLRPTLGGAVINGAIMLDAGTVTVTAPTVGSSGGTVYRLYLDGSISGAGDLVLLGIQGSNVYGTVVLGAASSYTGATLLTTDGGTTNNNIFVELGTDNALPTTTVLTLDGLNGTGSGRSTQLNLMGYSQTLAGLTNVPRTSRSQRVVNTSATPAILMIDGSGDDTFSGFLGTSTTNGNYALTKSGTGTLTLSGNRAYTGDTTVNGGILSLGNVNANDDLSTMAIASGAKLELSYAGTDTVAALVINGALQLDGVYGHADSGADNGGQGVGFFDTFFAAGTGTITVIGGFSSWITGTFANGTIPGGQQGPNDDYDSDGVSNLVEYAVDGEDPTVPNAAIGSFTATTLSFTKRAGTSGLTYAILESADLGVSDVWEEVAGGSYVNDPTTISYTLTPGTPVRNFIRLQVLAN